MEEVWSSGALCPLLFFFLSKGNLSDIQLPAFASHSRPPTRLTSDCRGPGPLRIGSLELNLNLGATGTTMKEALSLFKINYPPNNCCAFSFILPFIERATYLELSEAFWLFNS